MLLCIVNIMQVTVFVSLNICKICVNNRNEFYTVKINNHNIYYVYDLKVLHHMNILNFKYQRKNKKDL